MAELDLSRTLSTMLLHNKEKFCASRMLLLVTMLIITKKNLVRQIKNAKHI